MAVHGSTARESPCDAKSCAGVGRLYHVPAHMPCRTPQLKTPPRPNECSDKRRAATGSAPTAPCAARSTPLSRRMEKRVVGSSHRTPFPSNATLPPGPRPRAHVCQDHGHTPLHAAARCGAVECCKALLEAGADVDAVSKVRQGVQEGGARAWVHTKFAASKGAAGSGRSTRQYHIQPHTAPCSRARSRLLPAMSIHP